MATTAQTIFFADVAGSTRLYETLGDHSAQQAVAECLSFLSETVTAHRGVVIKTLGDAVMARFDSADDALLAALDAQTGASLRRFGGQQLRLYAGFHHGDAVLADGDAFGDAVNVAARVTGIARAGQILTTGATVERLSNVNRVRMRRVDRTAVKGRRGVVTLWEAVWERGEDVTYSVEMPSVLATAVALELRYADAAVTLTAARPLFVIGRSNDADLIVASRLASREHCRIEYRRDRFWIIDQSTNGTFVSQEGRDFYLRREELQLLGDGAIGLGEMPGDGGEQGVEFRIIGHG